MPYKTAAKEKQLIDEYKEVKVTSSTDDEDFIISGSIEEDLELYDLYMDLELQYEDDIAKSNKERFHKREFTATIDTICTRLDYDGRT